MKRTVLFSLIVLLGAVGINAQQKVKDSGKYSVIRNSEFMDRMRLQPEWYHYWIYYKKVLGIKIPLVGLGLHDSYAKKDMRNINQELPTIAATMYTKSQADKESKEVGIVYNQELFKFADRTVDYQYTLTNSRRKELYTNISSALSKYRNLGGDKDNIKILEDELERIKSNISIIHDSHMSNSKKREAYISHEQELMQLLKMISMLNSITSKTGSMYE